MGLPVSWTANGRPLFLGLGELPPEIEVVRDEALRLSVPLRTYRSPLLADWVEAVLESSQAEAARIAEQMGEYPIALTRDLAAARTWLVRMGRGERRYGVVASSGASRLRAEGLGVSRNATDGSKIAHWYLDAPGDVRSSFALEVTANEYTTQGWSWTSLACVGVVTASSAGKGGVPASFEVVAGWRRGATGGASC